MDRVTRKAIRDEFRKYYQLVKVFGYKPIKPLTSPIDWWILNSLYSKKNKPPGDKSRQWAVRHYCRMASAEKGTNQSKIYVFMTHLVDVEINQDGTRLITTHLNWKYSPTSDPLDTVETSVSGTSLIDDFIPRDPERDIEPIESSFDELTPPCIPLIGRWARFCRKLRFIRFGRPTSSG